jgi:protein gp37
MSKIEWTEKTWNPLSGCSPVSTGCKNCYAEVMTKRLSKIESTSEKYGGLLTEKGKFNGVVKFDEKALLEPLSRKKPTMYFVNSMSDLFHENVPFEWVDKIMAVIALCPQHTFQVLTKRPERMKEYFYGLSQKKETDDYKNIFLQGQIMTRAALKSDYIKKPYDNLWLGVSIENQAQADKRITYLLETPAAVRFLSCEPLLEFVNLAGYDGKVFRPYLDPLSQHENKLCGTGIDWVIVGGESGHNARPMHPDWVRSIRDQCKAANVAFFFKQWGEYNDKAQKVGKKAAENLLDGVQYLEFPKTNIF